jgi:hypothetical protein
MEGEAEVYLEELIREAYEVINDRDKRRAFLSNYLRALRTCLLMYYCDETEEVVGGTGGVSRARGRTRRSSLGRGLEEADPRLLHDD